MLQWKRKIGFIINQTKEESGSDVYVEEICDPFAEYLPRLVCKRVRVNRNRRDKCVPRVILVMDFPLHIINLLSHYLYGNCPLCIGLKFITFSFPSSNCLIIMNCPFFRIFLDLWPFNPSKNVCNKRCGTKSSRTLQKKKVSPPYRVLWCILIPTFIRNWGEQIHFEYYLFYLVKK